MANMTTSNVQDNEILKAVDINNSFDAQITNIAKTLQCLLETDKDFIIAKDTFVTPHSDGDQDWTINLEPVFAISSYDGTPILETSVSRAICSVSPASSFDRIDTVEIRGVYEDTDIEERAFIDFDTNDKSINTVYTKRQLKLQARVLQNSVQSVSAPAHTDGWIKVCEIFVPTTATKIIDCTFNNITSDVVDVENEAWTNEKTATYNIHYISDLNKRFRVEHNVDGSHKNGIIHAAQLDVGSGAKQINNSKLPIGGELIVCTEGISSDQSTLNAIKTIVDKINGIYEKYRASGDYTFSRELKIYGNDSSTYPTGSMLKFGINEDNSAYIKIGSTVLLTIKPDGTLTTKASYEPVTENDIVNKKVTDKINQTISGLNTRLTNLEETSDKTIYANNTLSRYSVSSLSIAAATTINISLKDEQTIDGIDCISGMYVLVKNQTDSTQNGLYKVSSDSWSRIDGFIKPSQLTGLLFVVKSGSINAGKMLYCPKVNFIDSGNFGSDAITFSEFFGTVSKKANKVVVRDAEGHVKAADSVSNEDCITRNEIVNGGLKNTILNFVYPVGSLYWSSKNTDPGTLFGGTWQQITNTFVLAAGSSYAVDKTKYTAEAGASSVTLNTTNLPSHSHSMTHSHSQCSFSGNVAEHSHSFTPSGSISDHTHKVTAEGDVSVKTDPIFTGEEVDTGGMSDRSSGWFEVPGAHSTVTIYDASGNVSREQMATTYHGLEDLTTDKIWKVNINVAHTHSVTAKGTISKGEYEFEGSEVETGGVNGSKACIFTGEEGTTGTSTPTCSVSGSTSSYSGNTGSTGSGSAFNIMPPYLVRYCWERIA